MSLALLETIEACRSDDRDSVALGEAVAIGLLEEQKETYAETLSFSFTRFDGTEVTI